MKNKKLFHACMAGMLSAAMLMTSVPVMAAEFDDDPSSQGVTVAAEVQTEEQKEEVFDAGVEEVEDFSSESARAASEIAIDSKNFPDSNFRTFVQTLDKDGSKGLSTAEIKAVTKMDVSGKGIAKLNGIERFTSLKELNASNNKIASVNLTKNTALTEIYLSGNKLTSIDLTKNTKLTYINLSKNSLKGTLNLSKCTAMVTLVCSNNALTKITMPSKTYLKKLDYIDVSHNKFTTQANAGLATISKSSLKALSDVNVSYNSITSFNCSGFEGILDVSNNKITTFTGGSEGYQAAAIYLEGSGNTLSKTSTVDFASLGNRVPQRFSCNSAVKKKIVMVSPRLTAKAKTTLDEISVSFGSTSDYASYKLERKTGSGAYKTLKTWSEGEVDDPEFGDDGYVDKSVAANTTYTYRLTATVKVQDRNQKDVSWSKAKEVTVKTIPGTMALTVKSSAKKVAAISWKAVSGASGYDVYYGTSKSKVTSKVVTGTTKLTVNKTKLTSGKTYYFRARAYRVVNGKKVYGAYSAVKSVKVK
ncbi:MAG: leucine-rich repeat domain-containing protein [Eubacteriales bacterium]|nr:leucine-rich repeat domain-containing protein [Eubacteriales bacterium]